MGDEHHDPEAIGDGVVARPAQTIRDPIQGPNTVLAWSYSALYLYELCPAQYYWARIAHLPQKPKSYFERGNALHKSIEKHLESNGQTPLDPAFDKHGKLVKELLAIPPANRMQEQQWGFTSDWRSCGWGKGTWFRCKLDVLVDYGDGGAEAVDWKSGRKWEHNEDELQCYALATMHRFPHVQEVTTRLVYLDGPKDPDKSLSFNEYKRKDLPSLTKKWEQRAGALFAETQWLPRPNARCKHCDFRRSEGGPCRYG